MQILRVFLRQLDFSDEEDDPIVGPVVDDEQDAIPISAGPVVKPLSAGEAFDDDDDERKEHMPILGRTISATSGVKSDQLLNVLVNGHGSDTGIKFPLPKNVRVVMMCQNIGMKICTDVEGIMWFIAMHKISVDLSLKVDKFDIPHSTIIDMFGREDLNLCVYSGNLNDTCPNLKFTAEEKERFRHGIYEMPIKVSIRNSEGDAIENDADEDNYGLSTMVMEDLVIGYGRREVLRPEVKSLLFPKDIDSRLRLEINSQVLNDLSDPDIYLSTIIDDLVAEHKNKLITIFIYTCRKFQIHLSNVEQETSQLVDTGIGLTTYLDSLLAKDIRIFNSNKNMSGGYFFNKREYLKLKHINSMY